MKKLILTLSLAIASYFSYAQTNTFPLSGNVGIGTTSPTNKFEIKGTPGAPASTGTTQTALGLTIAADQWNSLDFGNNSTYDYAWIQSTRRDAKDTYDKLALNPNGGNVGIGTTSPTGVLHLNNSTSTVDMLRLQFNVSGGGNWAINPFISGISNGGLSFVDKQHSTTPVVISNDGFVGIGTTNPQEALSVNGNIRSREVKIEATNWPDYVFKKEYKLPSLSDVKTFIDKNNHLPDMPSEAEVEKNGINIGEIVKIQTKKIEELTLYLIKQKEDTDKQIKLQQYEINQLKRQLKLKAKN
ncbi:hypothetical protein GCM10027049_03050 [Mucilaginibacter puniceus]